MFIFIGNEVMKCRRVLPPTIYTKIAWYNMSFVSEIYHLIQYHKKPPPHSSASLTHTPQASPPKPFPIKQTENP